jgi:hypothetical protein
MCQSAVSRLAVEMGHLRWIVPLAGGAVWGDGGVDAREIGVIELELEPGKDFV